MVSVNNPINTEDVRERAAKNLSRFNSKRLNKKIKPLTGDIVKPIQLSKTEPLVRRMTGYYQKNYPLS